VKKGYGEEEGREQSVYTRGGKSVIISGKKSGGKKGASSKAQKEICVEPGERRRPIKKEDQGFAIP